MSEVHVYFMKGNYLLKSGALSERDAKRHGTGGLFPENH